MKYLLLFVFFFATPALAVAPVGHVQQEVPEPPAPCNDSRIECNCYLFVQSLIPSLPETKYLEANVPPTIGSVALFTYPDKENPGQFIRHYAYVIALNGYTFRVKECNYKQGTCGERDVSYDDSRLDGFWKWGVSSKSSLPVSSK